MRQLDPPGTGSSGDASIGDRDSNLAPWHFIRGLFILYWSRLLHTAPSSPERAVPGRHVLCPCSLLAAVPHIFTGCFMFMRSAEDDLPSQRLRLRMNMSATVCSHKSADARTRTVSVATSAVFPCMVWDVM